MALISLSTFPTKEFLHTLLQDKTTNRNIIFATNAYKEFGFDEKSQITQSTLNSIGENSIQPRVLKSVEEQAKRTRSKAEVFTPSWICNKMNNHCDEEWFGKKNVFNTETKDGWKVNRKKVAFENESDWQKYIESKRIEITCGEAPYIVSRYDASTGEPIEIKNRIGVLDRKLRVVRENTTTEEEWLLWAKKAFQNVYGYEFQGDNLLIARINLLLTFTEYYSEQWKKNPGESDTAEIAEIIAWNFWQMDGITGTIPFTKPKEKQPSLFDFVMDEGSEEDFDVECKVKDWENESTTSYIKIRDGSWK